MRKLLVLVIVATLLCCAGCGNGSESALEKTLSEYREQLPRRVGEGLVLVSMKYDRDNNNVVFTYRTDEDIYNVSELQSGMTKEFAEYYYHNFAERELMEEILCADAGVKLIFKGNVTGIESSMTLSTEELRQAASQDPLTFEGSGSEQSELEDIVSFSNSLCPVELDGADLVLSAVTLEDKYVVHNIMYNDSIYDYSHADTTALAQSLRSGLEEEFRSEGGREKGRLLKSLGYGVQYRYVSTYRGDTILITIN